MPNDDIDTIEQVERMEAEGAAAIVKRGIRRGQEFRCVRKVAGFRANEIATMFDVTPETVSRWESGKQPLPRTVLFALAELYEHRQVTRRKLETLAAG